jgi:RNA polymerase sigma factor (sigma-70 family)
MQPPTEPRVQVLRGDEEDLYRRHHRDLERAVARAVHAPRELIEDACQSAWMTLLRNQPRRGTFFAWLRVVAIHEAYRLSAIEQRDVHLEDLPASSGWDAATPDPRASIDEALEARAALQVLADLPARQREYLTLLVAGFTYKQICELTRGRSYTNVNKHLTKARARIRRARSRQPEATTDIPASS